MSVDPKHLMSNPDYINPFYREPRPQWVKDYARYFWTGDESQKVEMPKAIQDTMPIDVAIDLLKHIRNDPTIWDVLMEQAERDRNDPIYNEEGNKDYQYYVHFKSAYQRVMTWTMGLPYDESHIMDVMRRASNIAHGKFPDDPESMEVRASFLRHRWFVETS